jgi:hypothetical protein
MVGMAVPSRVKFRVIVSCDAGVGDGLLTVAFGNPIFNETYFKTRFAAPAVGTLIRIAAIEGLLPAFVFTGTYSMQLKVYVADASGWVLENAYLEVELIPGGP